MDIAISIVGGFAILFMCLCVIVAFDNPHLKPWLNTSDRIIQIVCGVGWLCIIALFVLALVK